MKYAIVDISGSQYIVEEGKEYILDLQNEKEGSVQESSNILFISDNNKFSIGTPYIPGATIEYQIVSDFKGPKLDIFKYKAKSRYRKSMGFRARLTKIKVTKINLK